ncbi:MAG: proline--tRNA ligase [Nitrososphaerota archaeon]
MSISFEKKVSNFTEWFDKILEEAKIVDNRYPVKGFLVYREYGYKIIENIRLLLERKLEETNHKAMLFPIAISEDSFSKEAEHIAHFKEEVFWIEKAGGKKLDRMLVLRPTSETAIYPMLQLWIRSHVDLPFKMYQSVAVYRYETKATRPLFRVREILWNEAHTAHATPEDAEKQVEEAIKIYSEVFNELGIAYFLLKRPEFDKFAGAVYSIAFDAWNPDGKVNQIGTVHNLGINFSKVFNVKYEKKDGTWDYVYTTCYGFGFSRTLAAIIAQHGDDHGCVFPSIIAPIQLVIIPIPYKDFENDIEEYCKEIFNMLKNNYRITIDDRKDIRPGEKFYYWELLGVPIRIEIGPLEVKERTVTLVRRDNLNRKNVPIEKLQYEIKSLFNEIDNNLKSKSNKILEDLIENCFKIDDVKKALSKKKIARIEWCGNEKCAETLKNEAGGEIRGTRVDIIEKASGKCLVCGKESKEIVYVARAY